MSNSFQKALKSESTGDPNLTNQKSRQRLPIINRKGARKTNKAGKPWLKLRSKLKAKCLVLKYPSKNNLGLRSQLD